MIKTLRYDSFSHAFPPWDSLRLLVCYRARFSVSEAVESVFGLRLTLDFA